MIGVSALPLPCKLRVVMPRVFLFCSKKANVNGGAIALGHPLGASGARITTHLAHRLAATGGRYAVGAACIGGGQGIAVILENVAHKK